MNVARYKTTFNVLIFYTEIENGVFPRDQHLFGFFFKIHSMADDFSVVENCETSIREVSEFALKQIKCQIINLKLTSKNR